MRRTKQEGSPLGRRPGGVCVPEKLVFKEIVQWQPSACVGKGSCDAPAITTEKVSIFSAPEPFLSDGERGTSWRPTLRLNTMPAFSLAGAAGLGGWGRGRGQANSIA